MIDPPATPTGNLQSLSQPRQLTSIALSEQLNLRVGATVTALVEKVSRLDPGLQQRLIESQQTSTSASSKALLQNLQTSTLPLQIARLVINDQTLLAVTDQPLQAGQQLQAQLKTASQLVLLEPAASNAPKLSASQQLLAESFRDALPRQQPLHQLLQLVHTLGKLPLQQQRQLLPPALRQSLLQLQQNTLTPEQAATAKGLQRALEGSGIQLESRLQQLLNSGNRPTLNLAASDLKAGLLQLSAQVATQLALRPATAPPLALNALLELLSSMTAGQAGPQEPRLSREQLLQSLQQQLQSAIAKMQTQQLHSLSQQLSRPESAAGQHWNVELPIRFGDQIQGLNIRIDQDWIERQGEDKEPQGDRPTRPKERLWTVMLGLDLPGHGQFHAQLRIIREDVSASLWAEEPATLIAARQHLSGLRKRLTEAGINVVTLECNPGKPPGTDMRVGYSLVNTKA